MDFYSIRNNISVDEYDEEVYKGDCDDLQFENDLTLAIQDECEFKDTESLRLFAYKMREFLNLAD